jgi:3-methyl-2-oxobutanoate hydroxymethyltransferase
MNHPYRKFSESAKRIIVLTAYDAFLAKLAEESGVDLILVGDSLANVVLGYNSTRMVGMDEMLLFTSAVSRSVKHTHILADMPWKSDQNPGLALVNAYRFIEAGAHSVKIEGEKYNEIAHLSRSGISVVGHLGLTPQTAVRFSQVGKDPVERDKIIIAAHRLQDSGISALVLEHVPGDLAEKLTNELSIPVIGIGAGHGTDGQVLVIHDVLGMFKGDVPKIAKKFADLHELGIEGLNRYTQWVNNRGKDESVNEIY